MCDLGIYPILIILAYVVIIALSISVREDDSPVFWIKVLFWPITLFVYILGIIFAIILMVPRKLFEGICICFKQIKNLFIDIWNLSTSKD